MKSKRWEDVRLALGYVASIGVFVFFIAVVLPVLFGALPNVVVALLAMALLAPLAGVIIMALQGEIDWRPRTMWSIYLRDTVALLLELLFLVLIMPVIAFQIIMVLVGVFAAALLIGLVLFGFQELSGVDLNMAITMPDAIVYVRYLILSLLAEGALLGVFFWLKGKEDSALDAFVEFRHTVMAWLRPHAQDDPQERRRKEHRRRNL